MRTRRYIFGFLILACGFLAGLVLTGRISTTTDAQTPAVARAGAAQPAVQSSLPLAGGVPDFSAVAADTVPAVANISSTQVIARQSSPFSNDPFLNYFFGNDQDLYGEERDDGRRLGSGVNVSAERYILHNN